MKNLTLLFSLSIFFIMVLISSCDYYNHRLKFHNKSREIVTVEYADRELPDELNNVEFYIADYNTIKPDSTNDIIIGGKEDAWHFYIDHSPRKKLFVYVFSVKEISQYRGDVMGDIIRSGKYLKRFEYTEQELINKNWLIEYPGQEK